jgi:hypothetical protein
VKISANSDTWRPIDFIVMGFGMLLVLAVLIEPYLDAKPDRQPQGVWYYCDSTMMYYPHVAECKEGWQAVPATPATAPPPTD